jgi:hypothetical protein
MFVVGRGRGVEFVGFVKRGDGVIARVLTKITTIWDFQQGQFASLGRIYEINNSKHSPTAPL